MEAFYENQMCVGSIINWMYTMKEKERERERKKNVPENMGTVEVESGTENMTTS